MKEDFIMEENVGFSKFEILEKVVQATRNKNISVEQVEKQLNKIKAKADQNGTYSNAISKAVVDHFKLEKRLNKSDKTMIAFLAKRNKQLKADLPNLKDIETKLDILNQKMNQLVSENPNNYAEDSSSDNTTNSENSDGNGHYAQMRLNNENPNDDSV